MKQPSRQSRATASSSAGASSPKGPACSRALGSLAAAAIFLLGLVAGGVAVYFGFERPALDAAHGRILQHEQDIAAMRGRLERAESAAAALDGRLMVEEGTRRGLETSFRTLQAELGRAQDTLAFYEQLVPPGPKGAVTVRALDIGRVGPHLRYRVLLMRSGANGKPFEGSLQFVAQGSQNGESVSIPLQPIVVPAEGNGAESSGESGRGDDQAGQAGPDAALLDVGFTDFQRASGLLGLPAGFEPESVTLNVLEGRTLRTSHSVELPATD